MKKKLIIALATLLVLALAVPALAAAVAPGTLSQDQAKEITNLHKQMMDIRKQMVDKYVEYGQLTPEQGKQIKANIDSRQQYFEKNPGQFKGMGRMGGCRQGGGGMGPGMGGTGCYWNNNSANQAPSN